MPTRTTVYLADLAHTAMVTDTSLPVPLGIGYISAYLHAYFGESVEIKLFKHPERLIAAALESPPTVLGMAHYGWNDKLNQAIGQRLRASLPDTLLVGGGPNIDQDDDLALGYLQRHDYLDFYILEGGEEPFSELVNWWVKSNRKTDGLPQNVIWTDSGVLHKTGNRALSKKIEAVPSPYLGGFLDEFIDAGMIPLFETNRGCPFRCTFCAWGMASHNLVRRFSLETALAEIEYVGARSSARSWIVCDANFGMLKRDVEIAQAIRNVKDEIGKLQKCNIWLAKNATKRNLEIAEIMGDMVIPVMAVQSMDSDVLKAVKRDNIGLDTYQTYQQRFHAIGSKTYSDVIVPLPDETLQSHLDGLRKLFDLDVDIILNHNCRMLAGCELNSTESREKWGFRTRYRLIHGDAGSYKIGPDEVINCFEYEESLRETTTMSEADLFFLRRFHFLIDFCWNNNVYKPILKYLRIRHGISPVDIFLELCDVSNEGTSEKLSDFWKSFEEFSVNEWFDNAEEIELYFAKPENFNRLLDGGFEKLNILFSIIALRDFKLEFDSAFWRILEREAAVSEDDGRKCANLTFTRFPPLHDNPSVQVSTVSADVIEFFDLHQPLNVDVPVEVSLKIEENRAATLAVLSQGKGRTISKILNTQGFSLRDLSLTMRVAQNSQENAMPIDDPE